MEAATFEVTLECLKALAHESRLMMLCILAEGEKSVSELEETLSLRQPTVSQQLARLRADGLVATRRDGKTIYYSLASEEARVVIGAVYDAFYEERNFSARAADVRVPVLYTQGFEDSNVKSAMITHWFNALAVPKLGLFGHWVHQHPVRADRFGLRMRSTARAGKCVC